MDLTAAEKEKAVTQVEWDLATIERGGYAHFMLKEIMEQPESVRNTLRGRLLGRGHGPIRRTEHHR